MAPVQESAAIAKALHDARTSMARAPEGERARLQRRCDIVERYDLRGESRESICRRLRISQRTFYLDRRALLARTRKPAYPHGAAPSRSVVKSPLAVRFREAELLIQVGARELAAKRLGEIAANASDENDRIAALGRLVQVECDAGRVTAAHETLASAHDRARVAATKLQDGARAAILAAEACCSFAQQDAQMLTHCAESLDRLAMERSVDPQLWSLAATAWARTSYYHYLRQEITAADAACARSEAALAHAGGTRPSERAGVLSLRAEIDRYDPTRAHRAGDEDADAYRLAVEHGMVGNARVALCNTLIALLWSDDAIDETNAWVVKAIARAAYELAAPSSDTMITTVALAMAILERYDDSIALLARCDYHPGTFDWSAVHRMLQARILFKAGRFHQAERAARAAFEQWDRSGLGGEGRALRIRAEALEALGERRSAAKMIAEALEALRPCAPVYHLLPAYRCAARLAPRRAYQDEIESLSGALRKQSALSRWSEVLVAASRAAPSRTLTKRQHQIALLAAAGHTNPAIARELGVSTKTVANHLATIFERLDLRARWQLTRDLLS
jgi:DNA-binding CsgD family transcriptional regulator